jgi:hypothetical protein
MKYVEIDEVTGEVSWDRYFAYLESVKASFPSELHAYASAWEHYALDSKASLHDAWLTTARFAHRDHEVTLEFLGPWHDRTHVFRYRGVKSYAFDVSLRYGPDDPDVLAHEFRIEDGAIVHEIVFVTGKAIVIACEYMNVRSDMHVQGSVSPN